MSASRRILILGEDTQSFLTVIRSLGRAGFEVHVAWCPLDSAALNSRFVHYIHNIPAFQPGENAPWISAFQCLLQNWDFALVLPTTDSSILPLQLNRSLFEPFARLYLLPDDVFSICADKSQSSALAHSLGISTPRGVLVSNIQEALAATHSLGYPLVLKPTTSANSRNPTARQKVQKARSEAELTTLVAEMTSSSPVLAQQNFIGLGIGVEVLCTKGRILLHFQHERVHEPLQGGGSSYRRSVVLSPDLLDATRKLMESLSYTGVAMVEFKLNRSTGEWIFVEINARFWGSLPLTAAAGLDFPLALVLLLLDGFEPSSSTYRIGMYCRHWGRDLQWFLGNLRADKSNPELQTQSHSATAMEALNILAGRERSDTFTLRDPAPAFHDLHQFFAEKFFRVLKLVRPFRNRHHKRLRRLYTSAESVIVCCHGNICRSPFAGILVARTGRQMLSRGVHPIAGRASPVNAIAAAHEFGTDLESHRSSLLTLDEIRSADLILIFDRRNWLSLRALAPQYMHRVAFLGAGDPEGSLEIPDPYGEDLDAFRSCYVRITKALQQLSA